MNDATPFTPGLTTAPAKMELIPHDSASGRALAAVIAILTFLACLAAGGAVLLAQSSAAWRADVSREVTIQIKPRPGVDDDAAVAAVVKAASQSTAASSLNVLTRADTEKALTPWLGSGMDFSGLPIPRLVVVTLATRDPAEIAKLEQDVAAAAPTAVFDDHAIWLSHLTAVGRSLTAFAAFLFALVVAAIAIAVAFATRGAVAGAREIIEVLHFVGASDRFITTHFQAYFFRLSAKATLVGGGAAIALFLLGGLAAGRGESSAEGVSLAILLGSLKLPVFGYVAILAVCGALVAMTGLFSRFIAAAYLRVVY